MRLCYLLEYFVNKLDGNPDAAIIYERHIADINLSDCQKDESYNRYILQHYLLLYHKNETDQLRRALYDSIGFELDRTKIASNEIKKRPIISADEAAAFKEIIKSHTELKMWAQLENNKKSKAEEFDLLDDLDDVPISSVARK